MATWTDALRQRSSNMQPGPVPDAASPGMGGGNIPYASGATTWRPSTEPVRNSSPASPQLPQGAGNGQQVSGPQFGPSASPGGAQQSTEGDPYAILRFARYLMDRYTKVDSEIRGYRG